MKRVKLSLCYLLFISLGFCCFSSMAFAQEVKIARYLSAPIKPQMAQQQLLQQRIQVQFPGGVLTMRDAVQFILQFSGYRLVSATKLSCPVNQMLNQDLPEVDRHLGPVTLEQALRVLSGKPFYLLVDPVHRFIGFSLRSSYKALYQE